MWIICREKVILINLVKICSEKRKMCSYQKNIIKNTNKNCSFIKGNYTHYSPTATTSQPHYCSSRLSCGY